MEKYFLRTPVEEFKEISKKYLPEPHKGDSNWKAEYEKIWKKEAKKIKSILGDVLILVKML